MYVWKVWQGTKFVGYIHSGSQFRAIWEAQSKYGKNVLLERIREDVSPKQQESTLPG